MKHSIYILLAFLAVTTLNSCNSPNQQHQLSEADSLKQLILDLKDASHLLEVNLGRQLLREKKHGDIMLERPVLVRHRKHGGSFWKEVVRIKKTSHQLNGEIMQLQQTLIKRSGGFSIKTHSVMFPLETEQVRLCMITENNANVLKYQLDKYVKFLNDRYARLGVGKLPLLTLTKDKDFAHTYFDNTPVILALAYLTHFQNMVINYQKKAIIQVISYLTDETAPL
ncbi:hypothetical protein [Microscilla marina]|uniref:Gliding motility-associated protein GldM N-terminal domain-containing protein n=1 Tax=Microscilla marina ATCC 23134 TaxID=313606 RepID=A1ZXP8_MICM2|nr:hypothetical protein [Microscilla marina]EAY24826.1 hypothetical protein M23134_06718 [Microscilla marina ATCC 23134]